MVSEKNMWGVIGFFYWISAISLFCSNSQWVVAMAAVLLASSGNEYLKKNMELSMPRKRKKK